MRRAWKYRLYPTPKQAVSLHGILRTCQRLYNDSLEERRTAWKERGESLTCRGQCKTLTERRAKDEDLADVNAQVLQDAIRRLDKAFQNFYRRVKAGTRPFGYPRFKAWHRYDSFTFPQWPRGATLLRPEGRQPRLRIRGVGEVRVVLHREPVGVVKTCTILRDVDRWFVVLVTEQEAPPVDSGPALSPVGVDLGLEKFATLSTGESVENPRWLRASEKRLTRRQRRLSRRKKGSKNRARARVRLAVLHRKVRDQRADFCHKLSRRLVDDHDLIAFEDLQTTQMIEKAPRSLSRSIGDAGWDLLVQQTLAKAEGAGRRVVLVDPSGTSQECSGCGAVVPKPLSERTHACPTCGLVVDRDINAARNVLRRGMDLLWRAHSEHTAGPVASQVGREPPELTPVERMTSTLPPGAAGQVTPTKQDAARFSGW